MIVLDVNSALRTLCYSTIHQRSVPRSENCPNDKKLLCCKDSKKSMKTIKYFGEVVEVEDEKSFIDKKTKELGYDKIWLSVLNKNERAINFYKKSGFKKIGYHDFQIGRENFEFIAMKKEL